MVSAKTGESPEPDWGFPEEVPRELPLRGLIGVRQVRNWASGTIISGDDLAANRRPTTTQGNLGEVRLQSKTQKNLQAIEKCLRT